MNLLKQMMLYLGTALLLIEEPKAFSSCIEGVSIEGEFLYWKVSQDQIPYAAVLPGGLQPIIDTFSSSQNPQVRELLEIKDPNFKYKPGFRIALGYTPPCSNWNFNLSWTRLHEKIASSTVSNEQGIIPTTMPVAIITGFINREPSQFGFGTEAKSQWKFQFDTWDLLVGRKFSICGLENTPYLGVKAATINQSQKVNYLGFSVDGNPLKLQNKMKNHFRGIGPCLGINSSWAFCNGWSLWGDVSGALLCGRFDLHSDPSVSQDITVIGFKIKPSKKTKLRPTVGAQIGIGWDTMVCDQYHVTLDVAYEAQYWWNQWQAPTSVVNTLFSAGHSAQGDLSLYGLTAKLGVGF